MFACPSIHNTTGKTAAHVVDGHDSKLILREGAEATNAVAGGCYAVHFLETILRQFGPVLDDIIRYRLRVARVPGQCDAGCRGFCNG